MNNTAYIWDLDGTLLDSYSLIVSSIHETFLRYGIELDDELVHEHVIKYSVSSFFQSMVDVTGKTFEEMRALYSEISANEAELIEEVDGALETLKSLKEAGARYYVFTHRGNTTEPVLRRLGMYDLFEEVLNSKSGFARKPEPDAINYLVDKYNLDKSNTYYVGDRTIDMDCAKNAGIQGILYLPEGGYCKPNGAESKIITKLAQLRK